MTMCRTPRATRAGSLLLLASILAAFSGSTSGAPLPLRTWFFDWIPDAGASTGFLELTEFLNEPAVEDPANATLGVKAGEFNFNEGLFTETFDVLYFQEGNPSLGTVTGLTSTENGLITDTEIRGGSFQHQ